MSPYPEWRFFPAYAEAPPWVSQLVGVFADNRTAIDSTVVHEKSMESNDVLGVLAEGLKAKLGFEVETGKTKEGKLRSPTLP